MVLDKPPGSSERISAEGQCSRRAVIMRRWKVYSQLDTVWLSRTNGLS